MDSAKYQDIKEISEDYDLAIIATPTDQHMEQLKYLDGKIKYIYCEKPLCKALDKGIFTFRSQIFVGNCYRFDFGTRKLKELMPKCGQIRYASLENAYSFKKLHPHYKWEDYDGIIFDDSHCINSSRYLFGNPIEYNFKMIRKDRAMFAWKTIKEIEVYHDTNILNEVYKKRIEVVGELGNLVYNWGAHHIYFCPADESPRIAYAYDFQSHLFEAMKYVVDVVKKGGEFEENTVFDACIDMQCIEELLR